jgi:hypothetical protein
MEVLLRLFLTLALDESGQPHAYTALCAGKGPRYPLNRGLGGPQSFSGLFKKRQSLDLDGNRTLECPTRSLVIILTTSSWLRKGRRVAENDIVR